MTSQLFNQSCSCNFQHVYEILSDSETNHHNLVCECYKNPSVDYKCNISLPTFVTNSQPKISTLTFTLVVSPFLHLSDQPWFHWYNTRTSCPIHLVVDPILPLDHLQPEALHNSWNQSMDHCLYLGWLF